MTKKTKKQLKKPAVKADNFREGDIVAAKVKGHPIWPGRIVGFDPRRKKFQVEFYGTGESSSLFKKDIKFFQELTAKEKACSRKAFQEAYKFAQQDYEDFKLSQNNDDDDDDEEEEEDKSSTADSSSPKLSDPAPPIESEIKEEIIEKEVRREDTTSDRLDTPILDLKASSKNTNQRTSTKLDESKNDETIQDKVEVGENTVDFTNQVKEKTINKLKAKLARKEKEKEERKIKEKEKRNQKKLSPKLDLIINKLGQLSKSISELTRATSNDQADLCQTAVQTYEHVFIKMNKCFDVYILRNKIKPSDKCRECRETLVSLKQLLAEAQKNKHIQKSTKKELKKIRQMIDASSLMKSMVTDDPKNAMTERKENDAE